MNQAPGARGTAVRKLDYAKTTILFFLGASLSPCLLRIPWPAVAAMHSKCFPINVLAVRVTFTVRKKTCSMSTTSGLATTTPRCGCSYVCVHKDASINAVSRIRNCISNFLKKFLIEPIAKFLTSSTKYFHLRPFSLFLFTISNPVNQPTVLPETYR